MINRRLFPRADFKTKVYFEDETGLPIIWLQSRDLSLGGLFVEGAIPIRLGSHIFCSFELKKKKLSFTGEVMRTPVDGFGIRFLGLKPEEQKELEAFLTS